MVYIDEAGDRGWKSSASTWFGIGALVFPRAEEQAIAGLRSQLCNDLQKPESTCLHFSKNIPNHSDRIYSCQQLGCCPHLTLMSVLALKHSLTRAKTISKPDGIYLYCLKLLLERVSWYLRARCGLGTVTIAHLKGLKTTIITDYVETLRSGLGAIEWSTLPHPFKIDQPKMVPALQLTDMCISAIAKAFEPDSYGNTEHRYLVELSDLLYRRNGKLLSYGLKLLPTEARDDPRHAWLNSL